MFFGGDKLVEGGFDVVDESSDCVVAMEGIEFGFLCCFCGCLWCFGAIGVKYFSVSDHFGGLTSGLNLNIITLQI